MLVIPQSLLSATFDVNCTFILNTFTYWLLRNLYQSSISHKQKIKMQNKFYLIIFVIRDNPPHYILSGSLIGSSPTNNESVTSRTQLHPNLKVLKAEKRKSLRHNLCRSWKSGFMLVDRLATWQLRYFLKINFVTSWVKDFCAACTKLNRKDFIIKLH